MDVAAYLFAIFQAAFDYSVFVLHLECLIKIGIYVFLNLNLLYTTRVVRFRVTTRYNLYSDGKKYWAHS